MLVRLLIAALTLAPLGACVRHTTPTHLVGATAADASEQLGVPLSGWQPATVPGYEVSCALGATVPLYHEHASVCVVRRAATVAALDFRVDGCVGDRYDALRTAVIADFGLTDVTDRDIYVVRRSGVIHLRPGDDAADLVVTDSRYGDLYVKEQLRQGFVDLSNGLRPH